MAVDGFGFSIMGIIVILFIVVIGMTIFGFIIYAIVSSTKQRVKNDASPKITCLAEVVNKRQNVRGDHSRTYYFVTFELDSGERIEFSINGEESGMLVDGDKGEITFQGTRFLGFERKRSI